MNDTKVNNRLTTGELFDSWDGIHMSSGIQVLVLIVYKSKVGTFLDYDRLTSLAQKVGKIKHYNILSYHKIVQNDVQIGITMEFPQGPPIRDFLMAKPEKRLSEIEARNLFKQMIDGIDYLHSKEIVHRTLNFHNVYVTSNGTVKIGDYLISTKSSSIHDHNASHLKSIYHFLEPEFWGENLPDDNGMSDVWSLGVLLYVMVCGCYPYPGDNAYDIFLSIKRGRLKFRDEVTDSCANLIRNMLLVRSKRLNLEQVKNHSWVLGANFNSSNLNLSAIPEETFERAGELHVNLAQQMNLKTPPVTPTAQYAPPNPFSQSFDSGTVVALDNFTGEFFPYDFDSNLSYNPASSPAPSSPFVDPYLETPTNFTSQPREQPQLRQARKRSMDELTLRSQMSQLELQGVVPSSDSNPRNSLEYSRQNSELNPNTIALPESPRPTKKHSNLQSELDNMRSSAKKQLSFDDSTSSAFQQILLANLDSKKATNQLSLSHPGNSMANSIPRSQNSQISVNSLGSGESAFTPSRRQTVSSFPLKSEGSSEENLTSEQNYFSPPIRRSFSQSGNEYNVDRNFPTLSNQNAFHFAEAYSKASVHSVEEEHIPTLNSNVAMRKVDAIRALRNHQGRVIDLAESENRSRNQQQQMMVANAANRSQSPITSPQYLRDNNMMGGMQGGPYAMTNPIPNQMMGQAYPSTYLSNIPPTTGQMNMAPPQPIHYYGAMPPQRMHQPTQEAYMNTNIHPNPPPPSSFNLDMEYGGLEFEIPNPSVLSEWLASEDPNLK